MYDEDFCKKYIDEPILEEYKRKYSRKFFSEKELKTETFANALVLPITISVGAGIFNKKAGVLDENGNLINSSKIPIDRIILASDYDENSVEYVDEDVIYAGCFPKWHWGHFILELTSRLYYFLDEKDTSKKIVYTAMSELEGNYLEFFELLGIDKKRLVFVDKPTKFKSVTIPDVSMVATNYYTKEYSQIFEALKNKVEAKNIEKVFFTTTDYEMSKNKDMGQIQELESFFKNNGYEIISPEKLSLREQISILKNCKYFAAPIGTLPHNLLFANKDTKAIILNKCYFLNYHQSLVDQVSGINPIYVDAQLSFLPNHHGSGPFFYHINDNVKNFANDFGMKLPKDKNLTKYLWEYFLVYCYKRMKSPYLYKNDDLAIKNNYKFYLEKIKNYKLFTALINWTYVHNNSFTKLLNFGTKILKK